MNCAVHRVTVTFFFFLLFILSLQTYMCPLYNRIVPGSSVFEMFFFSQVLSISFHKIIYNFLSTPIFSRPSVLIPLAFQSVILLTSFISSILLRCHRHFILCACTYFTPVISYGSSLLFLILHSSLNSIRPDIILNKFLSKRSKLSSSTLNLRTSF